MYMTTTTRRMKRIGEEKNEAKEDCEDVVESDNGGFSTWNNEDCCKLVLDARRRRIVLSFIMLDGCEMVLEAVDTTEMMEMNKTSTTRNELMFGSIALENESSKLMT